MDNIVVVPYNIDWPAMYREESARIAGALSRTLLSIHHIGSTSVPGLSAKPIIDIMPLVRSVDEVDLCNEAMRQLGYEPLGENDIPGRRYFIKGGAAARTHNVHTYEPDNPEVKRHLDFRDYLIAHPDRAKQYAELKKAVAGQYPHDIDGYIAGKEAFIKETIQLAHAWRQDFTP